LGLLLPEDDMKKGYDSMTAEELRAEYDRVVRKYLTEAILDVPRTVTSLVNEAVAVIVGKELGLRRWHNTWELTYNQKDGEFVRILKDAANQHIRDNAEELTRVFLAPLTKEDTRELKGMYRRQLYQAVEEAMEQRAMTERASVIEKLFGSGQ
jgi:hypothetical protein